MLDKNIECHWKVIPHPFALQTSLEPHIKSPFSFKGSQFQVFGNLESFWTDSEYFSFIEQCAENVRKISLMRVEHHMISLGRWHILTFKSFVSKIQYHFISETIHKILQQKSALLELLTNLGCSPFCVDCGKHC